MKKKITGFVNPFTDFGFKRIFGASESKDVLIGFLNAVLELKYKIKDLEYLNSEKSGRNAEERKMIFDIRCRDTNNQEFLVELQNAKQPTIIERMIFYTSQIIYEQGEIGKTWKYNLNPIYSIAIQNFERFTVNPNYIHHVMLKNKQNEVVYDKLQYVFIEIPKFKKSLEECETEIDYWFFVFKHMGELEIMPKTLEKIDPIQKAFELAKLAKLGSAERREYEAQLKTYRDNLAIQQYYEHDLYEEAFSEGKMEEKLNNARNLFLMGLPIQQICQGLHISEDELKQHGIIE